MEEIILKTITWSAPEYKHKEKSMDFLWAIGLITIIAGGVAIWLSNYVFAIFIFIAGATLILFSIRHPQEVSFSIETEGLTMSKDKYPWKRIKGFHIKREFDYTNLLILTDKYFLPVYTIPLNPDMANEIREELLKVTPNIELEESKSMIFMEKLGF